MAQPTLTVARSTTSEEGGQHDAALLARIDRLHRRIGKRPGRPTVARELGLPESRARQLLQHYDATYQPDASQHQPAHPHLAATQPTEQPTPLTDQAPPGSEQTAGDTLAPATTTLAPQVTAVEPQSGETDQPAGETNSEPALTTASQEPASTSQTTTPAKTDDGEAGQKLTWRRQLARCIRTSPVWLPVAGTLAMAWHGQFLFALHQLHLPISAAALMGAFLESLMLGTNRTAHRIRRTGERALALRCFAILCAALAAGMNYAHFAGTELAPNQQAITYGLASVLGFIYWEITASSAIRAEQTAQGHRPPPRPVQTTGYGPRLSVPRSIARTMLHPISSARAWDASLVDPHLTADQAWRQVSNPHS